MLRGAVGGSWIQNLMEVKEKIGIANNLRRKIDKNKLETLLETIGL